MTNPPARTGFWAQGADGLRCPGWAHLQGLLIPGETWLHSRLLGPSGLSFPICAMGTLFRLLGPSGLSFPICTMGTLMVFTLQGCAERQSPVGGLLLCKQQRAVRAEVPHMGQSPSPQPRCPWNSVPSLGVQEGEEKGDQGREARGLGLWGGGPPGRACGGCRAHSCLLGLVMNQTR